MQKFKIDIDGVNPLLLHRPNIEWSERTKAWQKDPANKKISVPGDDRSPSWIWIGCLYVADGYLSVDADLLMACLREGGKKCPAPTGKGSMKAATQSGIIVDQIGWIIQGKDGKTCKESDVMALANELDFSKHQQFALNNGFELFAKRATIGKAKHIRVRPKWDKWNLTGTVTVIDSQINKVMIENIWKFAGAYCGLGDWRPGSPSSGRFGTFSVRVTEI